MIARPFVRALPVRQNSLERFDQIAHVHFHPGFFLKFAPDSLLQTFSQLKHASRNRPFGFEWRPAAPDQQHSLVGDHYPAYSDHGTFWIFPTSHLYTSLRVKP